MTVSWQNVRWAVTGRSRAFWPFHLCAITGERIGFGEQFTRAVPVLEEQGEWQIMIGEPAQYISTQGQAILALQGNELIEELPGWWKVF